MRPIIEKSYIFLLLSITGLIFLSALTFPAAAKTAGPEYWPTEKWRTATPESQGMDSAKLAEMVDIVWKSESYIDSISVIRNGYLVLDAYNRNRSKEMHHNIFSCTKSIVSSLIGIAIDKGFIKSVKQPVLDFFPNKSFKNINADKRAMTLEHVLMMATGLKCEDSYKYNWRGLKDMRSSSDWVHHFLSLPVIEPPGTRFEYCNGASHLLSAIIQSTTGQTAYRFARQHLFQHLGIKYVSWPENRQRISIGYAEIRMRPHDMAKFGYLFLNNGVWNGKRVVSADWVRKSTRFHIPASILPGYGYQWWVANPGLYTAIGYKGQFIMVHPETNLVVVFTSNLGLRAIYTPLELLESFILPSVVSDQPLPDSRNATKALQAVVKKWQTIPYYAFKKRHEKETRTRPEKPIERYENDAFGFSVQYDPELFNLKGAILPPLIFRRKNITGLPAFAVLADDIPPGLKPGNTEAYLIRLMKAFPGASDFEVSRSEMITLDDGTKADFTVLNWKFQSLDMVIVSVIAMKDNKLIGVVISDTGSKSREAFSAMARSLRFRNQGSIPVR